MDDASLYKHIDTELPDPDRARQLIILCAARAPVLMPHEGRDPPSVLSEKGVKLLQEMKDDILLLLAERKVDMNVMATDQPGSSANGSMNMRPNEQNVNASTTAYGQPDSRTKSRCVFSPFFIPQFLDVRFDDRAKGEDDAWAAATQLYNACQETVVRELEQRQNAKDLRVLELPRL